MSLFAKHWEPDGRDSLSNSGRLLLSVIVTGVVGFLLEYIGIEVLNVFDNSAPGTIYIVTGIWAFGLGPVIHLLRRSSMLVPMAIVGGLFAVLVLFNHYSFIEWQFVAGSGFVESGLTGPRIWEFRDGQLLGISHPLLIAIVAGLIETIVVPVSIVLQRLITIGRVPKQTVTIKDEEEAFKSSVGSPSEVKVKHDFGFHFMRFIFFAYGIYFVYMIIGLLVNGRDLPVVDMFFINTPETINSVMKLVLMISMANVAAFNRNVRKEAAILLFIGHSISVGASLAMYLSVPLNPVFPNDSGFLLSSVLGDGVLLIVLVYYMVKPRPEDPNFYKMEDVELRSPASTTMRLYFMVFASLFTVFTLAIVYFRTMGDPLSGLGAVFGGPDPLVSNSLTKYGTLATIGWFLFARPRLRKYFVPTLVLAFSFSIAATIYYGLQGTTVLISRLGTEVELPWFMMQHIIVDGGGLLLLLAIRRWQYKVDFQITALSPGSAETVLLLHHAFREKDQNPAQSAYEVLRRLDNQVAMMRGRRRGIVAFPFWLIERFSPTLCGLRPRFSTMSREEARWTMRRYFLRPRYERVKALSGELADLLSQMGDVAHALVTLSYYSSSYGHEDVGYVLPDARARLQADIPTERPPIGAGALPYPSDHNDPTGRKPVTPAESAAKLLTPRIGSQERSASAPEEVDYCIIGSGAAGAVLAHRLAEARGGTDSICVVERGGYYNPQEDFNDDEMQMIRMLYAEGGLQTTRSFDFSILQGQCVGGTTVVNNAVCFQMPEISRSEWDVFGFEPDKLQAHYDRVASEINIDIVKPTAVNERVEELFKKGVTGYNAKYGDGTEVTPVQRLSGNFNECVGCGLCNIGCRRLRKLSTLETYIPWAQKRGVTIVPNTGAVSCETEGTGSRKRVTSLTVRTGHGEYKKIKIKKALILSGGAIASSRFLMRSNVGGESVGQGMSCNFAVPPVVEFSQTINAYDGLQMALFAETESFEAIFETTFNPPGAHAISVGHKFSRHAQMMSAYTKSANFTALIGSDPVGKVSRKRDVLFGRAVEWEPTENDISRIKKTLTSIARIAQEAGGTKIHFPTLPTLQIPLDGTLEKSLENFNRVMHDASYFNFITAHPQGGNLMGADTFNERVVDLDFRVRDCENLYVCDASVFPRGIRVNPQWTIMALASMAAENITEAT